MFNVGGGEILVVLLIALIFLGPDRMPDAAKKVGRMLGEFRRMTSGFQEEIRSAMDVDGTKSAVTSADGGTRRLEAPPDVPEPVSPTPESTPTPTDTAETADTSGTSDTPAPEPGHGDTSAA